MHSPSLSPASAAAVPRPLPIPLGRPPWIPSAATTLSLTGTFIQKIAVRWLVSEATHATTWLAAASLADLPPTLIDRERSGGRTRRSLSTRDNVLGKPGYVRLAGTRAVRPSGFRPSHDRQPLRIGNFSGNAQRVHLAGSSRLYDAAYPARLLYAGRRALFAQRQCPFNLLPLPLREGAGGRGRAAPSHPAPPGESTPPPSCPPPPPAAPG